MTLWKLATPLAATVIMAAAAPPRGDITVTDSQDLARAIMQAEPGDRITLADGNYRIRAKLKASSSGSASAPITVRAAHALHAHIAVEAVIGIEVTGAYWRFDGLDMVGVCKNDSDCEHAFHVVGLANNFELTDSRLEDLNAALKVNADLALHLPTGGLIADNEFLDAHPRHTDNPVALLNIDNAPHWVVRHNYIHGFGKDGVGEDAYGAFAKGHSEMPLFEDNLVECGPSPRLPVRSVGLSFGAHGMDPALCPPAFDKKTPCDSEVFNGVMLNNIVAGCSGDGIYLYRAHASEIANNTLIGTGGIHLHGPSSTALVRDNVLSGGIFVTDGAKFKASGNQTGVPPAAARDALLAPKGSVGVPCCTRWPASGIAAASP